MKKWTTMSNNCVTLEDILKARNGNINEVEIWAILGQTGHALQDLLLSINGRKLRSSGTTSVSGLPLNVTITPKRLICSGSGKVSISPNSSQNESEFEHPILKRKLNLNELELEAVGIFSLGKTVFKCTTAQSSGRNFPSTKLNELLRGMADIDHSRSVTLLDLLGTVSQHWAVLVGTSPISRFVAQLCKVTLGYSTTNNKTHSSCSSVLLTNHDSKSNRILNRCISSQQQIVLPPSIKDDQHDNSDEKEELKIVAPLAEVEFSRLDTSSASSGADDSVCSNSPNMDMKKDNNRTVSMPDLASPTSSHMNNNNNNCSKASEMRHRGKYGRRLEYQPSVIRTVLRKEAANSAFYENVQFSSSGSTLERSKSSSLAGEGCKLKAGEISSSTRAAKTSNHLSSVVGRKAVQRNPSRLYRVVRPLTDITPTISPATKRCVGPEFVVMAAETDKRPIVLELTTHLNGNNMATTSIASNSDSKQICVILLSGQKLLVNCSPHSISAGELLDNVLSNQDIKESCYFTLAVKRENEYWPVSSDTKLYKVAPSGWKDGRQMSSAESFKLYLRFKFHPESIDVFKDPNNKHQFYLQLRKDVLEGRYHLPVHQHFSLAGMALQTEFGDFSEDIHGDGEYFLLEHYLPRHVLEQYHEKDIRQNLTKLHRAHLSQSQGKTELRYCREIQRLDNYGFQNFSVRETKKPTALPKRHLGIHLQGIFLFETSKDPSSPHKILASFYWQNVTRIQYDKCRFQISVKDEKSAEKTAKAKFYVSELKSKLMFDLSSAHHQFYVQQRWRKDFETVTTDLGNVEYREPRAEKTIRSLKNRLLSKRQHSQRKLYTKSSSSITRSHTTAATTTTPNIGTGSAGDAKSLLVKRLTHYSSMADALVKGHTKSPSHAEKQLDCSDKENLTPNTRQSYRYKVYLEPDEDKESNEHDREPLQEKPIFALVKTPASLRPPAPPPRPHATTRRSRISIIQGNQRRRSESCTRPVTTKTPSTVTTLPLRKTGRKSFGGGASGGMMMGVPGTPSTANGTSGMRMGTRISLSALHRERLRLTSDLICPPSSKKRSLDLDYGTMEFKSLIPKKDDILVLPTASLESLDYDEDNAESVSDSLIERFDNMESEDSEPERQIVSVSLKKDSEGRLGLKITGTPSGIYIDAIDNDKAVIEGDLKLGDRLVAINGRSLENVPYSGALELIKKSAVSVQFLVSQIKSN